MNDEALNMSVRKFLKKVGVTSQAKIEEAVRAASGEGPFEATMTLEIPALGLKHTIGGSIETK